VSEKIRTILGDVDPREIQAVLPHEHTLLWNDKSVPMGKYLARALPTLRRRMRAEFRGLVSRGCNCFVDCNTSTGIQIPDELCSYCRATGMHLVAATGFYVAETLPDRIARASVDDLAEMLMESVTQGIDGSQARAGVVKVSGNGYELQPVEERTFQAAARVHRETGVPITTHSPKGGRTHVEFLAEHGVDPSRIALGHIEVNPWEDIRTVARKGAMLLFTNFGGRDVVPEDMIIAQIADLVRRGFVRQIMISVDMYLYYEKGRLRQRWPGGYVQIFDRIVPRLKAAGLKARDIDRITHDNPCRHLAF
jgi:phosphotriesterase-related protein